MNKKILIHFAQLLEQKRVKQSISEAHEKKGGFALKEGEELHLQTLQGEERNVKKLIDP